jgi:hypothetical protein
MSVTQLYHNVLQEYSESSTQLCPFEERSEAKVAFSGNGGHFGGDYAVDVPQALGTRETALHIDEGLHLAELCMASGRRACSLMLPETARMRACAATSRQLRL